MANVTLGFNTAGTDWVMPLTGKLKDVSNFGLHRIWKEIKISSLARACHNILNKSYTTVNAFLKFNDVFF